MMIRGFNLNSNGIIVGIYCVATALSRPSNHCEAISIAFGASASFEQQADANQFLGWDWDSGYYKANWTPNTFGLAGISVGIVNGNYYPSTLLFCRF